jgi:carbon-monoxide dehydrogenase small subunit
MKGKKKGKRATAPGRRRPAAKGRRTERRLSRAHIGLLVNGERIEAAIAPHKTLLEVLREDLGLTGTKHGCELGECGTCTVLIDGRPQLSCLVLGIECEGRPIVTVEGLADGPQPHPLQMTFAELGAAQCGYCTPGILCAAAELLERRPEPSRDEIREALSGNLCRCTGYLKIYEAIELAARRRKEPDARPAEEVLRGR